jgi:hypothetical protein
MFAVLFQVTTAIMKKSARDWSISKGSLFVADQFATYYLLKYVIFVSMTAVRCDEYFVHFVQSTKKIILVPGNGSPKIRIVFHKCRGSLREAPHDVNENTVSDLHSVFTTMNYIPRKAHMSFFPRCSHTSPTE